MLETGGVGLRSRVILPDASLRCGRGRPTPSGEGPGAGDASRVATAEPYRVGVLLRSSALRPTDASPLRVPGTGRRLRIQRSGRCLSWGYRPTDIVKWCRCVRLRVGRRMHRPYGCWVRGEGRGCNGPGDGFMTTPRSGQIRWWCGYVVDHGCGAALR